MLPETIAALEEHALASKLACAFYTLPGLTATVWLPITYVLAPWDMGLVAFGAACILWILLRGKHSSTDWKLSLFALRLVQFRYAIISLTAMYFAYHGEWALLFLTIMTTPLCGAVRLLMSSGRALEIEDLKTRFFDDVLAARGHSLTETR